MQKTIAYFILILKLTPSYAGGDGKLIVLHRVTKIPPKHDIIFKV